MKCLIIASDIGNTAPGIVYETLIGELVKKYDVSVIAQSIRDDIKLRSFKYIPSVKHICPSRRFAYYSFLFFKRNILDDIWTHKELRKLDKNEIDRYDVIISFASFHNYLGILLGYQLSKKHRKPWIIYSVDAIPSPEGWLPNNRFHRNTSRFISHYIALSDAFFSSNYQMLSYQLNQIKSFNKPSGVLYTPIRNCHADNSFLKSNNTTPFFLYTGSIYGPRKKEALLDGFELFLKECPSAKLVFVGKYEDDLFEQYNNLVKSGNLEIYGYSKDLNSFYEKSSVLIDLNAYFDNDVFLSSKIVNYLPLGKPIISVTGLNSPSRNVFVDDSSILHCRHDARDICNVMRTATTIRVNKDERAFYINMFKVENVLIKFEEIINKCLKH